MGDNDFKADAKGVDVKLDWSAIRKGLAWLRTTIITLALGSGGWHVYSTNQELADIQVRLAKCEALQQEQIEIIRQLREMPGSNPGGEASGPPLIAPDTTRKVEQP